MPIASDHENEVENVAIMFVNCVINPLPCPLYLGSDRYMYFQIQQDLVLSDNVTGSYIGHDYKVLHSQRIRCY